MADMASTWFPGAQLDRVDNNRPYEPANCRWATDAEQRRNRRDNVWVDLPGERLVLKDVARKYGINQRTLSWGLRKLGLL